MIADCRSSPTVRTEGSRARRSPVNVPACVPVPAPVPERALVLDFTNTITYLSDGNERKGAETRGRKGQRKELIGKAHRAFTTR